MPVHCRKETFCPNQMMATTMTKMRLHSPAMLYVTGETRASTPGCGYERGSCTTRPQKRRALTEGQHVLGEVHHAIDEQAP